MNKEDPVGSNARIQYLDEQLEQSMRASSRPKSVAQVILINKSIKLKYVFLITEIKNVCWINKNLINGIKNIYILLI